jgi:hypothetical protein
MHGQIGAKPRDFSRADLLLTGDTDSLLEQAGFEPFVPSLMVAMMVAIASLS